MQIAINTTATTYIGMAIGSSNITNPNYANHVIIDRSYIAAPVNTNFARGVTMNGPYQALVDSYVDGVKDTSGDYSETHGIWMAWAPGPYKIVDNYFGGVPTEIIFSGGTTAGVVNAIPSDIERSALEHALRGLPEQSELHLPEKLHRI